MTIKTLDEFLSETEGQFLENNQKCFVPIWAEAEIGTKVDQVGTITLISLNGIKYALTASHCFDNKCDCKYLVCINGNSYYINKSHFIPLNIYKNFDISYAKWSDLGLPISDQIFFDVNNINLGEITNSFVVGFPVSKGKCLKKHITSNIAGYGGVIYREYLYDTVDEFVFSKIKQEYPVHFFFSYQEQASDGVVKNLNTFDLRGMSGGGLLGFNAKSFFSSDNIEPKLCGIFIEKQKHDKVQIKKQKHGRVQVGIATKLEKIIQSIS